jgi:hypothetical protein
MIAAMTHRPAQDRARAGLGAAGACDLDQSASVRIPHHLVMWEDISTAPFGQNLELAVIDHDGPHALVFPCLRVLGGWTHAETGRKIDVRPTHWRPWRQPS